MEMPRNLASALRATTILIVVAVLLWGTLIAGPMWLTRWRMSRLLADYHGIYPTQSTWADAQKLMARWGKWVHYEGTCNSTECDFSIRIDDTYTRWIEKLSYLNQNRIYNTHVLALENWVGYHAGEMTVRFQVLDGKLVRTRSAITVDVEDAGPPEHYKYPLIITAQSRSNLSKYPRHTNNEPGVYGWGRQLDLHPDYQVSRPGGCETCIMERISYTPTLSHEVMVELTSYNVRCLTRWRPCTTLADLLPFGSGWRLWEGGVSSLYPASSKEPLPCHTEPRALARDAATVLEVETLTTLASFKAYRDEPPRELDRVRVLQSWKDSPPPAGSNIQVAPFQGEGALEYSAATAPEHLVPGHRVLLFIPENAPTDFSGGESHGVIAYRLDRCGVIDDTPSNLAAVQLGIAQDIAYRHPF